MSSTQCPQPADCDFEEVDDNFEFCSWRNVNREIGAPVVKKIAAKAPFNNGSVITLKCKGNNKYWCAENGGNSYVVADRGDLAEWELFRIIYNDDNTISIKSLTNDKYVYIGSLQAYMYFTDILNDASKFNLITNQDGSYSLKNVLTTKYVSAKNFENIDYFLVCGNKGKNIIFGLIISTI